MKVSVVIPLYNKLQTIQRTLESISNQKFTDFEVLVVNDGSTDGSEEIVRAYPDDRVRIINKVNGGISSARNVGIRETRHPLIAFIDADDEWLPEFLEKIINLADTYPEAGFFATDFWVCKQAGVLHPSFFRWKWRQNINEMTDYFNLAVGSVLMSAVAIRKNSVEIAGLFNEKEFFNEDVDLLFRLGVHFPIAYSPQRLVIWHNDAANRTSNRLKAVKRLALEDSFAELGPTIEGTARKKYIHKHYCQCIRNFAVGQYLAGYSEAAFAMLSRLQKIKKLRMALILLPALAICYTWRAKIVRLLLDTIKLWRAVSWK